MSRQTELRSLIMKAKQAYYYGTHPIMSDREYDALEDELRRLDPDDPFLAIVGAPIPPDSMLTKAAHRIPMGSQGKVNSEEQFVAWYAKVALDYPIHASLKGDGASAAAYYESGRLVQVISRGDGQVGEDITANAIKFKGLPAYVGSFQGAIRFEVILTIEDWGTVDPERKTNPRNLGSGIMGRKNGQQSELLTIFAFDIDETGSDGKPVEFETEHAKSRRLQKLGFKLMPYQMCQTQSVAIAYYQQVAKTRESLPMWIDGVVMKVDNIRAQQELGATAGRPKGQIAWKFDSEGVESTLLSISISGGHTGALVPNARFEPVKIGGTIVQNASLANWDEIKRLDLALGDRIWVIKANDIIPKIIRVTQPGKSRKPIQEPTTCPFCHGAVSRRLNAGGLEGVVLQCQNQECPKKSTGKIKRWIKSLDIQGIGDSVLAAMVEQLGLEDVSGLYHLDKDPTRLVELIINTEKEIHLGQKRADSHLAGHRCQPKHDLVSVSGIVGCRSLGQTQGRIDHQSSGWQAQHLVGLALWFTTGSRVCPTGGSPQHGRCDSRRDRFNGRLDRCLTRTGYKRAGV